MATAVKAVVEEATSAQQHHQHNSRVIMSTNSNNINKSYGNGSRSSISNSNIINTIVGSL
jgi:hypothetical protein